MPCGGLAGDHGAFGKASRRQLRSTRPRGIPLSALLLSVLGRMRLVLSLHIAALPAAHALQAHDLDAYCASLPPLGLFHIVISCAGAGAIGGGIVALCFSILELTKHQLATCHSPSKEDRTVLADIHIMIVTLSTQYCDVPSLAHIPCVLPTSMSRIVLTRRFSFECLGRFDLELGAFWSKLDPLKCLSREPERRVGPWTSNAKKSNG